MEYKTIIKSVKDYITLCPYIEELVSLEQSISSDIWSLEEGPNHKINISQNYIDGSRERIFRFTFTVLFSNTEEIKTNIEYNGFYEKFQEWIESNNSRDFLPTLREGLCPLSIEILTTGYFIYPKLMEDKVKYQIQLQMRYEKENEVWIA